MKYPTVTEHEKTFTVLPSSTNHMTFAEENRKIIFGGTFLKEIDVTCAELVRMALWSSDACKQAFTHEMYNKFVAPAREGDIVLIKAKLVELRRRGLKIEFEAYAFAEGTGQRKKVAEGHAVFVSHNGLAYGPHELKLPEKDEE